MKRLTFLVFIVISVNILPQSEFITQITNDNYDTRNPSCLFNLPYTGSEGEFVFEIQEGNKTNIGLIKYLNASDSFSNPVRITNNEAQNINPSVSVKFLDSHIVLFQTNINGNWDIAISKEESGNWTEPELLTISNDDDINPVFTFSSDYYPLDTLWIIYERANSIHLLSYNQGVTADRIIFQANDTISYTNATGLDLSPMTFSTIQYSPGQQKIVYREFDNITGILYPIYTLRDNGLPDEPKFFDIYGFYILTYTAKPPVGFRNIYYLYNWHDNNPEIWVDNPTGDLSSLSLSPVYIITENGENGGPCTYHLTRNDSTFISLNKDYISFPNNDTLLFTRVDNANSDNGYMGEMNSYLIYYTIFEDSADGQINLFGRKQLVSIGEVMEETQIQGGYILSQNYPNPFNPSTKLSFVIGHSSFVTLKVYDVLGNEVATLVNEYKPAGKYEVQFKAADLSSGVYLYRIKVGDFVETKKMIFLK